MAVSLRVQDLRMSRMASVRLSEEEVRRIVRKPPFDHPISEDRTRPWVHKTVKPWLTPEKEQIPLKRKVNLPAFDPLFAFQ